MSLAEPEADVLALLTAEADESDLADTTATGEAPDLLTDTVLAELSADLVLDRDLTDMVSRAREQGYATYDDILAALPAPERSIEVTDQVISYLGEMGVRVFDTAITPDESARATPNDAPEAETPSVMLDDPVRMYLREIGRVPLLTSAQEQDLARRMEMGLHLVRAERALSEAGEDAPTADRVACALYANLIGQWDVVTTLYTEVRKRPLPQQRSEIFDGLVPLNTLPEGVFAAAAKGHSWAASEAEDCLRCRLLEYALLPLGMLPDTLRHRLELNRPWPPAPEFAAACAALAGQPSVRREKRYQRAAAVASKPVLLSLRDHSARRAPRSYRRVVGCKRRRAFCVLGGDQVRQRRSAAAARGSQSASRRQCGEEVRRAWHDPAGPRAGGQHGPHPRRGKVPVPQRIQVFHVCDVVDSAGDYPRHRRSGAHDPHPRTYGGNDQPSRAHPARTLAEARARTDE